MLVKPGPYERYAAGADLEARKLGLLNFTAAAGLAPADALPLYLVGAADPGEAVGRRAEELLRKRRAAWPRHAVSWHHSGLCMLAWLRWLGFGGACFSWVLPLP